MNTETTQEILDNVGEPEAKPIKFLRPVNGLLGWRRFGFEVAVIGFGVGLALFGDQWVTKKNKIRAADAAYAAMYSDLSSLQIVMAQRLATQPCVNDRIKSLRDALMLDASDWTPVSFPADTSNARAEGNIPPVVAVPLTPWPGTAWKSALESGVAFQMPPERYEALSELFEAVDYARVEQNSELRLLGQLAHLNIPGPITISERRQAYSVLGEFNSANGVVWLVSATSLGVVNSLLEDIPADQELIAKRMRDSQYASTNGAESLGACYANEVWDAVIPASIEQSE